MPTTRTVHQLEALVRSEVERLEATDRTPPFGGWWVTAMTHVAADIAVNPYSLDHAIRDRKSLECGR